MTLLETIRSAHGGEAARSLGRHFGLSESEIDQAIRALVPRFGHALRRLAESRTGAPVVHELMAEETYARYLEEPDAVERPQAQADGDRVLDEILDGEHQRQEIARTAAGASGLPEETIARLMPQVAALTMGALGRGVSESSPTVPGRFGTEPEDTSGDPLARVLASFFGDEDVSLYKKP
jgi:hypothetical protein